MTVISEEISNILKLADEAREKEAQAASDSETDPSASGQPQGVGATLKQASKLIRKNGSGVPTQTVLQFVNELSNDT